MNNLHGIKKPLKVLTFLFVLIAVNICSGQKGVGINTTTLSPGSALQIDSKTGGLVQPRMTTAQMNAIPTPLDGALIYNTTQKNWYIRSDGIWQPFVRFETPSIILNKEGGSVEVSVDEILTPFPLNENDIRVTNPLFYMLNSSGDIKVLRSGTYLITAGFSTSNLNSGSKLYRIEVLVNNTSSTILTNGEVNLPSTDFWGTSGNILLILNANDVITLRYIFKGDAKSTRTGKFFNIGVSKL